MKGLHNRLVSLLAVQMFTLQPFHRIRGSSPLLVTVADVKFCKNIILFFIPYTVHLYNVYIVPLPVLSHPKCKPYRYYVGMVPNALCTFIETFTDDNLRDVLSLLIPAHRVEHFANFLLFMTIICGMFCPC